jgi:DNA replication protein DnaC
MTHLATALSISSLTRHGKRVRFYSTVDLVNALLEAGNESCHFRHSSNEVKGCINSREQSRKADTRQGSEPTAEIEQF